MAERAFFDLSWERVHLNFFAALKMSSHDPANTVNINFTVVNKF